MGSGYIPVGAQQLHYLEWGSGDELMIAFHGYGDSAEIFLPLEKYLSDKYRFICIDLPYHGKSVWSGEGKLLKNDLVEAVNKLRSRYAAEKISMLGYSLGGRVCLSIVECMPENIGRVVLLAPDGLAINGYYHFFTQTGTGKKVLNHMLNKPEGYLKAVEWLKRSHIISAARYKFAMYFLQDEARRKFLQKVWPNTSDLTPSPAKLNAAIKKYAIPVTIIMGVSDHIIPPKLAKKFSAGLVTVKVAVIDKGHRVFDNQNAQQIAGYFL